jgi:hypothetical protein
MLVSTHNMPNCKVLIKYLQYWIIKVLRYFVEVQNAERQNVENQTADFKLYLHRHHYFPYTNPNLIWYYTTLT